MINTDKELQLEGYRKQARARRKEEVNTNTRGKSGSRSRDKSSGSRQRAESRDKSSGSRQRAESRDKSSGSRQREESKEGRDRPELKSVPLAGDGAVRPKRKVLLDCTRRQSPPREANFADAQADANREETPSVSETEEDMEADPSDRSLSDNDKPRAMEASAADRLSEIDTRIDRLSGIDIRMKEMAIADNSKRKIEPSPGPSPPRKLKTPELVLPPPLELHIHRLPELARETDKTGYGRKQADQIKSNNGCTQFRPQTEIYQSGGDEEVENSEGQPGNIEDDCEMLNDQLDEAHERIAELEKMLDERVNELNKLLLDREEELSKRDCIIAALNKELEKVKLNSRVANNMIATTQVELQELQTEIVQSEIKFNRLISSKDDEIKMLQDAIAENQKESQTTDEMVVKEAKEMQRQIVTLTQANKQLEEEHGELLQMLKTAREEAKKQEAIARSYATRINQVRSSNLRRTESRMSVGAERRVLTMENAHEPEGDNDDDDDDLSSAGAQAQVQIPAAVHQLLKFVDWPRRKACFQHDEFCEKVEHTFRRSMEKGIPSHLLAESLHSAIQKQEKFARLYNSEIGTAPELTFDTVMGAIRQCDRVFSEKSNYEKWESVILEEDESIFSFCRRVERAYKDYKIGEEGNDDLQVKLIKERVIKGANLSDAVAASILTCENLQKLPGYIQQALDREPKTKSQTETGAKQAQEPTQAPRQKQQQPQKQAGPVKQTYERSERKEKQQQQQPQGTIPQRQQSMPQQQVQRQQPQRQFYQPPSVQQMSRGPFPTSFPQNRYPPPPSYQQNRPTNYQQNFRSQGVPASASVINQTLQRFAAQNINQPDQTQSSQEPQNQAQAATVATDQEQSKTVASVDRIHERAPTGFEHQRENRTIQMCTKCRRIQTNHRWARCRYPPFCSYCQEEGHTDADHRMYYPPPPQQMQIEASMQQRNEGMQNGQI